MRNQDIGGNTVTYMMTIVKTKGLLAGTTVELSDRTAELNGLMGTEANESKGHTAELIGPIDMIDQIELKG
jgi:hypothetical protein